MNRSTCWLIAGVVSVWFSSTLYAAEPAFEGKTIRIIV